MKIRTLLTRLCKNRPSEWPRKLIVVLLLTSIGLSVVPIPVGTLSTSEKDISDPFPCQNRPCGCRSAKQCWKQCCCFTNEQKVAWAKQNGVEVPTIVVEQLAANKKKAASAVVAQKPNCCSHSAEQKIPEATTCEPTDAPARVVIGVVAQQCQGAGHFLHSIPWCVIPAPLKITAAEIVISEAPRFLPSLFEDVSFAPPVPPPRLA